MMLIQEHNKKLSFGERLVRIRAFLSYLENRQIQKEFKLGIKQAEVFQSVLVMAELCNFLFF